MYMTIIAIREKLIAYLSNAGAQKVKAMYTLFEENIEQEKDIKLTKSQTKIIQERRKRHLSGEDKSYNWQEVHNTIRKNRKE